MIFSTAMVFITALEATVIAQCQEPNVISQGTGRIKSPNFDNGIEYGKKANCSWKFIPIKRTNYALRLDMLYLRLYYVNESKKRCVANSYNLTISEDRSECDRFAREENGVTFCHSYYNSYTCADISEIKECEVSKLLEFPVEVKYEADGRTIPGVTINGFGGFELRYRFVECQDDRYTTNASSTLSTTASPLLIVAGAAGGGILFLVLSIGVAICIKRRFTSKKKTVSKNTTTNESQQVEHYEMANEGPYHSYEGVRISGRRKENQTQLQENPGYELVSNIKTTESTNLYEKIIPDEIQQGGQYETPIERLYHSYEAVGISGKQNENLIPLQGKQSDKPVLSSKTTESTYLYEKMLSKDIQQVGQDETLNERLHHRYEGVRISGKQNENPIPLQENPGYESAMTNKTTESTNLYEKIIPGEIQQDGQYETPIEGLCHSYEAVGISGKQNENPIPLQEKPCDKPVLSSTTTESAYLYEKMLSRDIQQDGQDETPNEGVYQSYEAVGISEKRKENYPSLQENPGCEPVLTNKTTESTYLYEKMLSGEIQQVGQDETPNEGLYYN